VFATADDFGVLDAADAPVNLGGPGLSFPTRAAVIGGILFIGGGTLYGGSRKAADYSTGTISYTDGSAVVTGVGTAFLANADAGMLFRTTGGRYHVVASVDSDTQLTLLEPVFSSAAGVAYTLTRLGTMANHGGDTASHYAVSGQRLWALEGRRLSFSEGVNPGTVTPSIVGRSQSQSFLDENFHELPAGADGLGLAEVRGRLLIFTTAGVFALSGTAFDIRDAAGNPQHRIEHLSGELVLSHAAGLTPFENAVIAPCTSGIYVLDGISAPLRLDKSIEPLWAGYVDDGYLPGLAAVFRNHLFLPVLDSASAVQDFLVCRLDRPVRTSLGDIFGWTRFADHAAVRVADASAASLLGGGTDGRILDLRTCFEPAESNKTDADATAHALAVETRDYTAEDRNESLWRRVRLRYRMTAADGDDPVIYAYAGVGRENTDLALWGSGLWGTMLWSDARLAELTPLEGSAPETDRLPYAFPAGLRGEFIRYRFESSGPVATLSLRAVESFVRRTGKVFA
jgi:hypothetical protein